MDHDGRTGPSLVLTCARSDPPVPRPSPPRSDSPDRPQRTTMDHDGPRRTTTDHDGPSPGTHLCQKRQSVPTSSPTLSSPLRLSRQTTTDHDGPRRTTTACDGPSPGTHLCQKRRSVPTSSPTLSSPLRLSRQTTTDHDGPRWTMTDHDGPRRTLPRYSLVPEATERSHQLPDPLLPAPTLQTDDQVVAVLQVDHRQLVVARTHAHARHLQPGQGRAVMWRSRARMSRSHGREVPRGFLDWVASSIERRTQFWYRNVSKKLWYKLNLLVYWKIPQVLANVLHDVFHSHGRTPPVPPFPPTPPTPPTPAIPAIPAIPVIPAIPAIPPPPWWRPASPRPLECPASSPWSPSSGPSCRWNGLWCRSRGPRSCWTCSSETRTISQ